MKRILNIMTAAAMLILTAACQKEEIKDMVDPAIVGEWHMATIEVDGKIQEYPYDVYLIINSNCTFELYQRSGDQTRYTKFTGTCKSEGDVLSGVYSSGIPWGDSYTALIEGDRLVLMSSDGVEIQEYVKESLAEEQKVNSNISTKAGEEAMAPIL